MGHLNVFPIEMPPLRDRQEDIPLLLEYFIERYARKMGKKLRGIDKKTLDLLKAYPWPGKIRELQNVIGWSVIVCETETFSMDESWLSRETLPTQPASLTFSKSPVTREKEMIEAALTETKGRVSGPSGAAAKLGLLPLTLKSRIRSLKINKYCFKAVWLLKIPPSPIRVARHENFANSRSSRPFYVASPSIFNPLRSALTLHGFHPNRGRRASMEDLMTVRLADAFKGGGTRQQGCSAEGLRVLLWLLRPPIRVSEPRRLSGLAPEIPEEGGQNRSAKGRLVLFPRAGNPGRAWEENDENAQ